MPYFVIPISGDPDLARGLLARSGIQNVPGPEPPQVSARLLAASPEVARERVVGALADGTFTIGDVAEEH